MPITASLGALSYKTFSLAEFDYWLITTSSNKRFNSLEFDDQSNPFFYIIGDETSASASYPRFTAIKFREYNNIPYLINVNNYRPQATSLPGGGFANVSNAFGLSLKILSSTELAVLGRTRMRYPYASPNQFVVVAYTFKVNADLDTVIDERIDWGSPLTATDNRLYDNFDIDIINDHYYYCGYTSDGGTVTRKENFDSAGAAPQGTTEPTDTEIATQSILNQVSPPSTQVYDLKLNSNLDPVAVGALRPNTTSDSFVYIWKLDKNPLPPPNETALDVIWKRQLTTTNSLKTIAMSLDNSDDIYTIIIESVPVSASYIVKYQDSGASASLAWQRKITGVELTSIYTDDSGNSYILGKQSNNMFIAKYNSSGNIQWQRIMSGLTFIPKKIYLNTDLYICGDIDDSGTINGFVLKLPENGDIPGTGSYDVQGTTVTYANSSLLETAGSLIDSALTLTTGDPTLYSAIGWTTNTSSTQLDTNINKLA